jgi:IS605 OrfB family transposase
METVEPSRTVVCPLETSRRKNERAERVIDGWQRLAERMGDLLVTLPEYRWGDGQDTHLYRMVSREADEMGVPLAKADAQEVAKKVTAMYQSWRSNGKPGGRPSFGGGGYARFRGDGVTVVDNDDGYGLKLRMEPYNPEWWRIKSRSYHEEYLSSVVEGEASAGATELHLDGEELRAHIAVTTPVEVYEPSDTDSVVGVDLGERAIYAAAEVDSDGTVESVEIRTGDEFRHHRERLTEQYEERTANGDLAAVKELRGQRERYTKQVAHEVSEQVTALGAAGDPSTIVLEDLTGYRDTADDPIHDFPYALIQEYICYKATDKGLPVVTVDPADTSTTCRKCGTQTASARDGIEFRCPDCGYEVHADVNAAINIAQRA